MYVESDFLFALTKPSDWLKADAEAALEEYDVHTSLTTYNGFLFLTATAFIDEYGLTPNEAVQTGNAHTRSKPIISTDRAYDAVGVELVPLDTVNDVANSE
ncbi:hypothetical protein [Halobaculum roseum]|uniref:PIN domain-containing protein n=1 Tax=Halobaculum roseum TaxID=2175149 RepID=A0ABD5MJS7_9EURY|nr:hypothetical protein [Halobaculum roseum]QZY04211.1 hypothetical protein K6T36_15975 [Halobaculum roseum]